MVDVFLPKEKHLGKEEVLVLCSIKLNGMRIEQSKDSMAALFMAGGYGSKG